jgi:hypothetical protein
MEELGQRLPSQVVKVPGPLETECWLFQTSTGHANFSWQGKTGRASKFAYLAFVGLIKDGYFVLHKCSRASCINPDHLLQGGESRPVRGKPLLNLRKPTNARACACGETWFAYTSLCWIAIVDTEDAWLLRDYKWSAMEKSLDGVFYAWSQRYRYETGNSARLHQAVMGNFHGQLDHANNNGHDCRKAKLRPCTKTQNGHNRKKQLNNFSSKHKGVSRCANMWQARITVDGRMLCLGTFGLESDAAIVYSCTLLWGVGDQ